MHSFIFQLSTSSIGGVFGPLSTSCNSHEMFSRVVGHEVGVMKCPLKTQMAAIQNGG